MNRPTKHWMCEQGHRIASSAKLERCPAPLHPDGTLAIMGDGEPCDAEIEWRLVDPDDVVMGRNRSMVTLAIILLILALLLGGVGLFVTGLKWLLIIALVLIVASIISTFIRRESSV